ncbi:DUF6270 domain-containing protein [Methylosinus sp. Ce-a6]|uniref:DUF6270 domain-containing protein n=1 Tax=Methylosinus sp. Ce-a6 TaxID=2172005 RepID=UPI001358A945|nr:DUF6270 domain-containing protein [Methylosinus sp. Ce-a6]
MDSHDSIVTPLLVETKSLREPVLKSASFGGCTLEQLFEVELPADRFDHKHFWRATIPGLASEPTPLHATASRSGTTFRLLQREMEKPLYRRISENHYDVMAFDVAQDFATNHVVTGGTIFPDFRDILGEGEDQIDFSSIEELASYDSISADTDFYWDLWFSHFAKLHSEILEPKRKAGTKIFFVERYLCETSLSSGSFLPYGNIEASRRRNRRLRSVYERLSATPGIRLLGVHEKLFFTSRDAPWGEWEFHPEREYYFQMKAELLRLVEPRLVADVTADFLLEQAAERSKMRAERDAAQILAQELIYEIDRLRPQLAEASDDLQGVALEKDQSRQELARARDDLQDARERLARAEIETGRLRLELARAHDDLRKARDRLEQAQSESWLEKYLAEADGSGAAARSVFDRLFVWWARRCEMHRLRRAKFDAEGYLLRYPDVAAAGVDPLAHYILHGRSEGRSATFHS